MFRPWNFVGWEELSSSASQDPNPPSHIHGSMVFGPCDFFRAHAFSRRSPARIDYLYYVLWTSRRRSAENDLGARTAKVKFSALDP